MKGFHLNCAAFFEGEKSDSLGNIISEISFKKELLLNS